MAGDRQALELGNGREHVVGVDRVDGEAGEGLDRGDVHVGVAEDFGVRHANYITDEPDRSQGG